MKKDNKILKQTANRTAAQVSKEIFDSDNPSQLVQKLPPQSLYLLTKQQGAESYLEVLLLATKDQLEFMIDLDCWNKDSFEEDQFWQWLSLSNDDIGLEFLKKFLKSVDLKLVTIIIARYVDHVTTAEPTDEAPGPHYYTPDKGHTWVSVMTGNADKDFLLNRLLAVIFDTSVELFYQILAVSTNNTQTVLEEEAYQEKASRLAAEAIPQTEEAFRSHAPINENEIISSLKQKDQSDKWIGYKAIIPLVFTSRFDQLAKKVANLSNEEQDRFLTELSYIINSAIVYFNIPHYETEEVKLLAEQVKGAISIGIAYCQLKTDDEEPTIWNKVGLSTIYRYGYGKINEVKDDILKQDFKNTTDTLKLMTLEGLEQKFPKIPECFDQSNELLKDSSGKLVSGFRAFSTIKDLETVVNLLKS